MTDEARTNVAVQAIELAKANQVKTSLSLSDPFVVQVFGDNLRKVIGNGIDLLFCNSDEAKSFTNTQSNKDAAKKDKVLFIDGSDQVRVGRAQNYLEPEHITQLFNWYQSNKDVENYVKVASMDDIEENDFNLNIPLYVEKIIEDNLPSVEEALSDLKTAWKESQKAEKKFKTILNEFI